MNLINKLISLSKKQNIKSYQKRVIPNIKNNLGVPFKYLKIIAKDFVNTGYWKIFFDQNHKYYEEIIIHAYCIGFLKNNPKNIFKIILSFVDYIYEWSACDTFCLNLNICNLYKKEMFDFFKKNFTKKPIYIRIFCVVCLKWYLSGEYLYEVIKIIQKINCENSLDKLGMAWLISEIIVKNFSLGLNLLKKDIFSKEIKMLAIKKCVDSHRILYSNKEKLNSIKNLFL